MDSPLRHSLMCDLEWARHHLYPGPMPEPDQGRPTTHPECWAWHPGSSFTPPGWEWLPDGPRPKDTPAPKGLWAALLRLLK
jgi:hypothetical protein